jgi:hypothetical protein
VQEPDVQRLQTRPRDATQFRRQHASGLVVGLKAGRVLTVGLQVLQEGMPRRLVERILTAAW